MKTFDAIIKTSAAHIYVSAMTFCPRSWPLNEDIECSNRLAFSFPLEITWDLLVADMQEQQPDTIPYWPNAISPDRTRVTAIPQSPESCAIRIWDTRTGYDCLHPYYQGHSHVPGRTKFCADNVQVLSSSSGAGEVRLWDSRSSETLWEYNAYDTGLVGHSSIAVSPNGSHVVYFTDLEYRTYRMHIHHTARGGVADGEHVVWPVAEGFTHIDSRLLFSPNGKKLLYTKEYGDAMNVWDISLGHSYPLDLGSFKAEGVWGVGTDIHVAFSPDGTQLVAGGKDRFGLWDVTSGKLIRYVADPNGFHMAYSGITFSPSGLQVALLGVNNEVQIWDVATGFLLKRYDPVLSVSRASGPHYSWTDMKLSDDMTRCSVVVGGAVYHGGVFLCEWKLGSPKQVSRS